MRAVLRLWQKDTPQDGMLQYVPAGLNRPGRRRLEGIATDMGVACQLISLKRQRPATF